MPVEDEDAWVLPENMKRMAAEQAGVYGSFARFESGEDREQVEPHAIVDFAYAQAYARNLLAHLRAIGLPAGSDVLDIGCALGTITGALRSVMVGGAVSGIDLSAAAQRAAARDYPDCAFSVCSADDLSAFADASLDLIHAREFYPFTRTADPDFHMRFLVEFARTLRPGGAVAAVQIVERKGLADTLPELRRRADEAGFDRIGRRVAVPYRVYRHIGDAAYRPMIYPLFAAAGTVLERVRPGRVSYLYTFRKAVA